MARIRAVSRLRHGFARFSEGSYCTMPKMLAAVTTTNGGDQL
jgi:hypothetical protein